MECFWDNRTNLAIVLFAKLFANSKTQFWCFPAGGLSNSIWCWQYRRFNLWYCCHQIVWSALWVVHCFHRSHLFFLDFTQFWCHLVLTQFWCNFASQKPIFEFASLWCAVQSLSWNIGRKSIFQYSLLMRTFTFLGWTILSKSKFQAKLSRSWLTD